MFTGLMLSHKPAFESLNCNYNKASSSGHNTSVTDWTDASKQHLQLEAWTCAAKSFPAKYPVQYACCRHIPPLCCSGDREHCEQSSNKYTYCWHTASVLIRPAHWMCSVAGNQPLSKLCWWAITGMTSSAAADLHYTQHRCTKQTHMYTVCRQK